MTDNVTTTTLVEFFSNNWEPIVLALILALLGFLFWLVRYFIVTRGRRTERTADRVAKQKEESLEKTKRWAEDCLACINEIAITVNVSSSVSGLDMFSKLKKLEATGSTALSASCILDDEVHGKTAEALKQLEKATIAFRNRDGDVWNRMRELERCFKELIELIYKRQI